MQQKRFEAMISTMTTTVALVLMSFSLTAHAGNLKGFQAWKLKPTSAVVKAPVLTWGAKGCPCIGIDNVEGKTMALISAKKMINQNNQSYPADLGARCEAWDLDNHPKCPGAPWCAQKWCYVDPCNCNIPVLPKPASYVPDAEYQGKPVFFSYATCGGKDMFPYTGKADKKAVAKDNETATLIQQVCALPVSDKKWGDDDCRCVGVGPREGTTGVKINGGVVDFPASTGSSCNAWEKGVHPDCQGNGTLPAWCSKAWCYVDPCKCKLATPPKTSSYLPDGNYQGRPVYYSYATCGAKDAFSAGDKMACVNQKTTKDCAKIGKCAWSGKECLGKELVTVCKKIEAAASAAKNTPEKKEMDEVADKSPTKTDPAKSGGAFGKSGAFGLKGFMAFLLPLVGFIQA